MSKTLEKILADPLFEEEIGWRRRHFQPNQVVIREGEPGRSLYYLEEGVLRVSGRVELEAHRCVQPGICDLGPGEVFGELALFGSGIRTATVTAITEAQVVELDAARTNAFLEAHPELGYRLLRELFHTLVQRLSHTDRQLERTIAWGLRARGIDEHLK